MQLHSTHVLRKSTRSSSYILDTPTYQQPLPCASKGNHIAGGEKKVGGGEEGEISQLYTTDQPPRGNM